MVLGWDRSCESIILFPLGGALVALLQGDFDLVRIRVARAYGRLQGWRVRPDHKIGLPYVLPIHPKDSEEHEPGDFYLHEDWQPPLRIAVAIATAGRRLILAEALL